MNDVEKILLKKFEQKQLAHFYHIKNAKPFDSSHTAYFGQWMSTLLGNIVRSSGLNQQWENIADIFYLGPEHKKAQYAVSDFTEVFRMQQVRPLQLGHQFIVIADAHKLTTVMSNKLLKVLEEPTKDCSIFLLNPMSTRLMPTIESRALHIRLVPDVKVSDGEQVQLLQEQIKSQIPVYDFIDFYKKAPHKEKELYQNVLKLQFENYQAHSELLACLKEIQTSTEYRNSSNSRLFRVHTFLKNNSPIFT